VNRKVLVIGIFLVGILVGVLAMNLDRDPHDIRSPLVGRLAPDFLLRGAGGTERISLDQYRGRPLVVNFWATWCVPCYAEHPVLTAGARANSGRAQFLGVVYDDAEPTILEFLAQYGSSYPTLIDREGKTAIAYGVHGVPETFFISADGKVVAKYEGPLTPEILNDHLGRLGVAQ